MKLGKHEHEGNSDKIRNAKKFQVHWQSQVFAFEAEERKIGKTKRKEKKGISNAMVWVYPLIVHKLNPNPYSGLSGNVSN